MLPHADYSAGAAREDAGRIRVGGIRPESPGAGSTSPRRAGRGEGAGEAGRDRRRGDGGTRRRVGARARRARPGGARGAEPDGWPRAHAARAVRRRALRRGAMRIPRAHDLTLAYCERFGLRLTPFTMNNPQTYVYLGGCRWLYEAIVAPEGRIHFAGEHASLAHAWIQGAIESRLRAAWEIEVGA